MLFLWLNFVLLLPLTIIEIFTENSFVRKDFKNPRVHKLTMKDSFVSYNILSVHGRGETACISTLHSQGKDVPELKVSFMYLTAQTENV